MRLRIVKPETIILTLDNKSYILVSAVREDTDVECIESCELCQLRAFCQNRHSCALLALCEHPKEYGHYFFVEIDDFYNRTTESQFNSKQSGKKAVQ